MNFILCFISFYADIGIQGLQLKDKGFWVVLHEMMLSVGVTSILIGYAFAWGYDLRQKHLSDT